MVCFFVVENLETDPLFPTKIQSHLLVQFSGSKNGYPVSIFARCQAASNRDDRSPAEYTFDILLDDRFVRIMQGCFVFPFSFGDVLLTPSSPRSMMTRRITDAPLQIWIANLRSRRLPAPALSRAQPCRTHARKIPSPWRFSSVFLFSRPYSSAIRS